MAESENGNLVVVGSSAGGIEALSIFLGGLGKDFPAPVVLAQHLDPTRPSSLGSILERRTGVTVIEVGEHTPLENGKVYVVPSNRHVMISDHSVHLDSDHAERPRPSIDLLLSSAAHAYGDHLISVILTGAGSDGAAGAVEVKNAGGVVVIQNPRTAAHPSMPLALPPTAVDFVAELEQMGALLRDILTGTVLAEPAESGERDLVADILNRVTRTAHIDFRQYKPSTILRRIGRRMAINHLPTLEEYRDFIDAHPQELGDLMSSFLIKVTEFFRDPEAFSFLQQDIMPQLIDPARKPERTLRMWSAGCATGEEAYSLALMVADALGTSLPEWKVSIFATDVDEAAISFARRGLYPSTVLRQLPERYTRNFFDPVEQGFRIHKTLRQMVVFGQQDLSRGFPFPRIDLVLCRNLLIYFKAELQQTVLDRFAFSLAPSGGYLFLGKAETARPSRSVFDLVNKKWKIYRCVNGPLTTPVRSLSDRGPRPETAHPLPPDPPDATTHESDLSQLRRANEMVLRHLPSGVAIIDRLYRIVSVNAAARRMLRILDAKIEQDFLHSARGLPYASVRQAIDQVFREGSVITLPDVELEPSSGVGGAQHVALQVSPLHSEGSSVRYALVTIQDHTELIEARRRIQGTEETHKQLMDDLSAANRRLMETNKELQDANEELQANNEETMLAQEELQATNEEFEATNEELQASNEEFEATNEELQATNEELEATNEELQARSSELEELTRVLDAERMRLGEIVGLAPFHIMVLRGPRLVIESTNSSTSALFGERKTIGMRLDEISTGEPLHTLLEGVRESFLKDRLWSSDPLRIGEREFVFTARPTHAADDGVNGVAVYAQDVTDVQREEEREYLEGLDLMLRHADHIALGLFESESGKLVQATPQYFTMLELALGPDARQAIGRRWEDMWRDGHELHRAFREAVHSDRAQRLPELRFGDGAGESIWDSSIIPIRTEGRRRGYVLVSAVEVTQPVLAREQLERLDRLKDEFLSLVSHELRTPLVPLSAYAEVFEKLLNDPSRADREELMRGIIGKFRRQVGYMSRLIDDLVDVARLESGKLSLEPAPMRLREVVEAAAEQIRTISARPPIRVEMPAGNHFEMVGDQARLMQLIINLLSNAMKHAPESEHVDLVVRGPQERDGAPWVRIEVRDRGRGIPVDRRDGLFTRFFQAGQGRNREARAGLGLGLFIARGIAEQHGGRIGVEHHEPGSTFWVELPLAR